MKLIVKMPCSECKAVTENKVAFWFEYLCKKMDPDRKGEHECCYAKECCLDELRR